MSDVPVVGDIYDAGKSVAESAVNIVTGGLGSVLAKPDAPAPVAPEAPPTPATPTPTSDGSTTETQTELQKAETDQRRARGRASTILAGSGLDASSGYSVSRRTLIGA